jgi:membrane fusion protein (multidrug efflux system)
MATHAITTTGGAAPPRRQRRRPRARWLVLAAVVGFVLLLLVLKGAQIATLIGFGKRAQKAGPPPETVSTGMAVEQTWDQTVNAVGSIASARGVTISNDVAGIVWRIHFESGATVHKGEVLVELDSRVEKAQLESAKARQSLATSNLDRSSKLFKTGSIAQAQLDADTSGLASSVADVTAIQAQIDRKVVRAPFDGKLGIRLVNVGQYLASGTAITVLESSERDYVDFTLPQQELSRLHVGMPVRLTLEGDAGTVEGNISAVEPAVDPQTRNIRVRATIPATDVHVRPGMFVNVAVVQPEKTKLVAVPATSVVHASYGDSVFVVENGTARQQFVRLGPMRGDFIGVTEGVKSGQEIVTGGAFKLRNGMRVTVNNEVGPKPELAPRPINR